MTVNKDGYNKAVFFQGMRHAIPIGIGYFAVSVALGITARAANFTILQGFFASLLTYASAGQYAGFSMFATGATYIELIIATLVINARYTLMGFAITQRLPSDVTWYQRMLLGATITDEIFGITIARPGRFNLYYPLGAWCCAVPMWATGTAVGIAVGSVLPPSLVSAFSVALYGMFLAVIIPPSKKNKVVGAFVAISFAASYAATRLPFLSNLSSGNRIILLTVVISSAAAILFPVNNKSRLRIQAKPHSKLPRKEVA
ncbi:AzlC family ABC transporter permease [Aminicella lysinilytica]|uniref:AzlC family ABC transporter permease n=1 Tax=Aminicella lysinilytica TaxID=433323 RepID=UPI0026F07CEF|nr:AzlC family ABC transporter permease [Aminicella lysinilytica]